MADDERDEELDEQDPEKPDLPEPENDREKLILDEYQAGRIDRDRCEELLARAHEQEERQEREHEELERRHYDDDFDAHLDAFCLHMKHAAQRRALEFETLGIDLGGLASDYDHLLRNLSAPELDERRARQAAAWRSLSPEQQAEFKERVIAKGDLTAEELDELIREHWE